MEAHYRYAEPRFSKIQSTTYSHGQDEKKTGQSFIRHPSVFI
jgi:hypothetical protein